MNCEEFKEMGLTEYLDGLLRAEDRTPYETHLNQCAQCKQVVSDLQTLRANHFSGAQDFAPAEHVWDKIAIEIDRPSAADGLARLRRFFTLPRIAILAPVFASVLILVAVLPKHSNGTYSQTRIYLIQEYSGVYSEIAQDKDTSESFGTVIEDFFM